MCISFTLTRARSESEQHIFNYVKDSDHIFYVDHGDAKTLVQLKKADIATFRPISWGVAKDEHNIWKKDKKVLGVSDKLGFFKFDEEVELFSDGKFCFDGRIKKINLDPKTIQLIPYTNENRKKNWEQYNQYLLSKNLAPLAIECSPKYTPYILDKNGIYDYSNSVLCPLNKVEMEEILNKVETIYNSNILNFLNRNSHLYSYPFLKGAKRL